MQFGCSLAQEKRGILLRHEKHGWSFSIKRGLMNIYASMTFAGRSGVGKRDQEHH
jgi:hypothetical protein